MVTMQLSIAERKDRIPHGGQREAGKRARAGKSFVSAAVDSKVFPKTKRTKLKLRRVQIELAQIIGVPLEVAWSPEELARSDVSAVAVG